MMKTYNVTIPVSMTLTFTVEAESEEQAVDKAFEAGVCLKASGEECSPEIAEWEMHEHITQGNVFYGVQNSIEIEESDW